LIRRKKKINEEKRSTPSVLSSPHCLLPIKLDELKELKLQSTGRGKRSCDAKLWEQRAIKRTDQTRKKEKKTG
jgi:hypothetical protein